MLNVQTNLFILFFHSLSQFLWMCARYCLSVFVTGCSEVLVSINDVSFTNFSFKLVIEEKRPLITNLIV